jgi:hypothetical protein
MQSESRLVARIGPLAMSAQRCYQGQSGSVVLGLSLSVHDPIVDINRASGPPSFKSLVYADTMICLELG